MKHSFPKRVLSLLLCLCLILALFAGLAAVSAVGENAIRNWGVRDTVCTQLSSAAQSYYTGNNTYASLKALSGASSTANSLDAATNNDLYDALHTLMEDTHTTVDSISYSSHSSWYAYTDCENGDTSGKMKLLWAGGYRTWDGSYVNREHVWCKSHATYVETNGGADLHHLRPASAYVNQTPHNNKPYGSAQANGGSTCVDESGNFGGWYLNSTTGFSNGLYEPPDNAKGDCARILLYVYTRWKQPNLYTSLDTSSSAYKSFIEETASGTCDGVATIESLETLLKWCYEDPVDTWEMGRNDAVQSIQGNRNVFIDYPELAWYLFGMTPPSDMTTPSGDAASGGSESYSITNVTVNNPAYGTAAISTSNTVTVSPADGCYVVSATSTSGTASVNGNVITVTGMTADATVNVVLAQNASFTISFSVPNGMTQASMSGYGNSTITLPTPTGTPTANAQSYEFVGWTTGAVSDTTTLPTCYAAGSSYTITGNATLIALFRYNTSTGTGSAAFDPNGTGGTYVLAANVDGTYYALPVSGLGTARPAGAEITVTNGAVSATDASGYEWTLTKDGTAFNISGGGQYLTWSSSTSLGASSDAYAWTIEANDTTTWKIIPSGASTRSLIFRAGSYNVFGGYAVTNLGGDYKAIEILPVGGSSSTQTFYTTNLQSSCNHSYSSFASNGDGTHSKCCSICGDVITESCALTASAMGDTVTYTCSVCGYSYQTTLATYTVTYRVRGTVTGTENVVEGSSVTLPAAPAYTGYSFEGWAVSAIGSETQTAPDLLTGTYTPTANITLYAVYSRTEEGTGATTYQLVTDTKQLVSGRNLIVAAKDYDYAMAGIYNSYYRNQASVTKNGTTLTPDSGVYLFTLGAGNAANTWSLYDTTNDAYLTAYVSGSYYDLGTQTSVSADSSFTISAAADGTASLTTNSGACVVRYFRSSSYQEFKCVSASTTSNVYDIALYVETPGTETVTYYTTDPVVVCAHPTTNLTGAAAATCTAAGYTGDTVCTVCGETVTAGSVIPALGHNYSDAVTTPATCGTAGVRTYTCSRCGDAYTEAIPATGAHSYDSGVQTQAPSCTQAGVLTFTCTVCAASYTEPVSALGHNYGDCISNNDGTHSRTCSCCGDVAADSCSFESSVQGNIRTYTCTLCAYSYTEQLSVWTITLNNCGVSAEYSCVDGNEYVFPGCDNVTVNNKEYTFVGWVASTVEETTVRPGTVHLAGESYTPGKSMTYYALFACTAAGESTEEYRLVTATDQLAEGDSIVIAARSSAYAISASSTGVGRTSVSKSNNNANLTINSATVFTLEAGSVSGTWSFKSGAGYLSLPNNSYSGSMTTADSKSYPTSWTIGSIDADNGGTVLSAKRSASESVRYMRYSSSSFSLSSRSASSIALYKKYITPTEVTSYTTELVTHIHAYTSEVTTPATCLTAGVMTFTCSCGDSYTETIPALGHDIINHAAQAPTATEVGWNAYETCSRCDYTTYEELPALGILRICSAALRLDEDIDVIYTAEIAAGYTDPYMVFTMHGVSQTVTEYTDNGDGTYFFVFTGVTPQCMGDAICAKLYATQDGVEYTDTVAEYSVKQYCVNQLERYSDNAQLVTLLSDILTYGACAQAYMDYQTDELVSDGLDLTPSTFEAISGKTVSFTGEQDENTCWIGAALVLSNDLAARFTFVTDSTDGLTVEVAIDGRTQTFNAFEDAGDGKYYITFDGTQATEFDDTVTATFCRDGVQIGAAVNYSVNTYICSTQNSTNEPLAALVKALYNYGASAKAYTD